MKKSEKIEKNTNDQHSGHDSPKALTASELMEIKRISVIEMKRTLKKGNDERGIF